MFEDLIQKFKDKGLANKLNELTIIPEEYNKEHKRIYLKPGQISLKSFMQESQRASPSYVLEPNILIHLYRYLLELILFLHQKDFYHNDIRPENIRIFVEDAANQQDNQSV